MTSSKPLRLWPGVTLVVVQWLVWIALPLANRDAFIYAMLGGLFCALAIVVWWLFFSRAAWIDRWFALAMMMASPFVIRLIVDRSIENAGMGNLVFIFSIPLLCLSLVAWAVATRHASAAFRRATMIAALLVGCGPLALVRTGGVTGDGAPDLHWRWSKTSEELLLAQVRDEPKAAPPPAAPIEVPKEPVPEKKVDAPIAPAPSRPAPHDVDEAAIERGTRAEWPGFRGPDRDGVVHGVRINTDWTASPPVQMWRRPIGPGWSSFAVQGDLVYTQEQRGEEELVSCYRLSTGEPVWRHRDSVRFWESNGGAGPRATPTVQDGRVYTFGGTGMLNALDARTGAVVWSRNVSKDAGKGVPGWGFTSSPLVVDDEVIVAASGTLTAYDRATGKPRWVGPRLLGSYSSPHLATIDGVTQVLLLTASGAASFAPRSGTVLWRHDWESEGATIVQPALTTDGGVLIHTSGMTGGAGIRRLAVAREAGGWRVEERWTSTGLKPYFNDFVVHKGHAYGFDGHILSCIDLADGKRKWKGGRYGNGQLVLLADQDVLLVTSEDGDLALVGATPDQFTEIARVPALNAKTWNHPVIVHDVLLVRNGEEMAAFLLPPAAQPTSSAR